MPVNTGDIFETVVEYAKGDSYITVSSTDATWVKKILKVCANNPEDTRIVAQNPDGSICVKMPKSYLKLSPPVKRAPLTDEQKAANRERLRQYRESKASACQHSTV